MAEEAELHPSPSQHLYPAVAGHIAGPHDLVTVLPTTAFCKIRCISYPVNIALHQHFTNIMNCSHASIIQRYYRLNYTNFNVYKTVYLINQAMLLLSAKNCEKF